MPKGPDPSPDDLLGAIRDAAESGTLEEYRAAVLSEHQERRMIEFRDICANIETDIERAKTLVLSFIERGASRAGQLAFDAIARTCQKRMQPNLWTEIPEADYREKKAKIDGLIAQARRELGLEETP